MDNSCTTLEDTPQIMQWSDLTSPEIATGIGECRSTALLPVGATEQHGPHLGTGVDSTVAGQLCAQVAGRTGALVLPTLPYGCSIGHSKRWPGTLALQPITLIGIVKEIGDWAYYSGIRRLFLVNGHVTNAAPLRCALEMLRSTHDDLMVALVNTATISERVRGFHAADGADWHANDAETSLMLSQAPHLVRPELVSTADDPDRTPALVFSHPVNRTSLNGVTGQPSKATAQKGQAWFEWMVEDLSALVSRGMTEAAPLEFSYHSRMT
jgi:creatinine amidohydrolase